MLFFQLQITTLNSQVYTICMYCLGFLYCAELEVAVILFEIVIIDITDFGCLPFTFCGQMSV